MWKTEPRTKKTRNQKQKPNKGNEPVTIAVRPEPSIPLVTSSAVERAENPDGPLKPRSHIFSTKMSLNQREESRFRERFF